MLIVPYYIAAITIAGVAAITATFTMIGQEEILGRRRKRENEGCKPVSCDVCKHGPKPDESRKKACAKCAMEGFGRGFERQINDES